MISVFLLKLLTFFLRKFTKSSGTALPGLILEKYFPNTLRKLLNNFDKVLLVTGTNGKTTTSRMICHLLDQNNISYISNSSGSNLIRGIASVLIDKSNFIGKFNSKIAIFEVEEATMPRLVKYVKPEIIIVTNIFRDQLDAYGEIDKTYRHIKNAVIDSNNPVLILNYNDERVYSLKNFTENRVDFIGFDKSYLNFIKFENKNSDYIKTQDENIFTINFIKDDISNENCKFIYSDLKNNKKEVEIKLSGIHNSYNSVAAQLGFSSLFNENIFKSSKKIDLNTFQPAFGRGESIFYKNSEFKILLVKNPAGMNLNLELIKNIKKDEAVVFILNDKIADGRDVSWIWDCDFSLISNLNPNNIFISGNRRFDMALRIRYENKDISKNIFSNSKELIEDLAEKNIKKIYILPTYTAMREFRDQMSELTEVKKIYM